MFTHWVDCSLTSEFSPLDKKKFHPLRLPNYDESFIFSSTNRAGQQNLWVVLVVNENVLVAWVFYKESSWIKTTIFVVLILLSIGYILVQFFRLSSEESSTNPLYFVLVRRHKREHTPGISVVTARVIFSTLACLTLGSLIYTLIKDISGSYAQVFSKCFLTDMTDLYVHAVMLSVWIAYKESSWIIASLWIILHLCFGSITLCVYVVWQLFCLSPDQPASLIIFNGNDIHLQRSDHLLIPHANVQV
ncbi:unnamed protein product [Lactuca virosa]|uniref:THH1/TOM1/TOM3 domain-containing protein n=1 Tax=Lactuca virosa TaxID=75947 RepID=A0AAU9NTX4_9ASTR|nr:unnamed protein product [Lactuca virosa]